MNEKFTRIIDFNFRRAKREWKGEIYSSRIGKRGEKESIHNKLNLARVVIKPLPEILLSKISAL